MEIKNDTVNSIDLCKIQHGNFSEFEKLYRLQASAIYGYAYKTIRNKEDTEEIVQEVFADFWKQRNNIKSERIIWVMTKRKCIDFLRKKKIPVLNPKDWNFVYENTCKQDEILDQKEQKQKIFQKLAEGEKEVLTLLLEGHSRDEITGILNIPLGTVDSRLYRLKQKLKG